MALKLDTGGLRTDRGGTFSSSSYTAQGVHFDGATWLINAALASSDNGTASFSMWLCYSDKAVSSIAWVSDPLGAFDQFLQNYGGVSGDPVNPNLFLAPTFGTGAETNEISASLDKTLLVNSTWLHLLGSVRATGQKFPVYQTDALTGQPPGFYGTIDNTTTFLFNGFPFYIANDGSVGQLFDMADFWVAPGVSLLDGGGDIPVATRRKFIDGSGKPVYLGANGELPTGTAPAVFLSASAGSASSFATNRGTGGSFTTTGTLTLASTSPS